VRSGVEMLEGVGADDTARDDDSESDATSAVGPASAIFWLRASSTNLAWPPLFL
jgi:hypothetical protein